MASDGVRDKTPEKFVVGPYTYDVSFDAVSAYDYDHLGVTLYRSRRVKLDPRQSDTELPQTFLHEVLHTLGDAFEIDYWRAHKYDNGKVTDKIDLMASALLQFLRANPEAVKWMQEQK